MRGGQRERDGDIERDEDEARKMRVQSEPAKTIVSLAVRSVGRSMQVVAF